MDVLCVKNGEIVADGLVLGLFEIRLNWKRIGTVAAYRVIVLEPKPARANRLVTRPHVLAERLWEGSAASLLHNILLAGRRCEFFSVVNRLLTNYSPGRCYVEPEDWHLLACVDCADIVRVRRHNAAPCNEALCHAAGANAFGARPSPALRARTVTRSLPCFGMPTSTRSSVIVVVDR